MEETQPITGSASTERKGCWRSLHDTVARLPVRMLMNMFTIIFSLCLVPVVVFNILTWDLSPLHWIVSIYLIAGVIVVSGSCFPLDFIKVRILRWFLFLATYNGRAALLFMMGLLATGLSTWGIVAGAGNMALAAVHVLLWVFFSDIVGTEVTKIESRLGRTVQGRSDTHHHHHSDDVEESYMPPPTPSRDPEPGHEFSGSTNSESNPYAVAEAYRSPELDATTNYNVSLAQQRNGGYNPF